MNDEIRKLTQVNEVVKDFARVVKIDDRIYNVTVTFEVIECKEELTEEESDYLGIIRNDIYYLVHKLYDKVIIVTGYSDHNVCDSYRTVLTYMDNESISDVPVFFVIGHDYPLAEMHINLLCSLGLYQANHLVCLENNYVLVRTNSLKEFDTMNKLHYAEVLEFESHSASDIEPVKKETESVANLKKEVRELKKEQFKHPSTSKKCKVIKKAINDKKAEIAGVSNEEAKFAPDLEVVNLWYERMIAEDIEPKEYIEELEDAIENERLWIKGSRTDEEKYMHEVNISTLERTIEIIKERTSLKKWPVNVGMLKDILKDLDNDMPIMFSLGINENDEIGYTSINVDTACILHNPADDFNSLFLAFNDSSRFATIYPDMSPEEIIERTEFEVVTKLM